MSGPRLHARRSWVATVTCIRGQCKSTQLILSLQRPGDDAALWKFLPSHLDDGAQVLPYSSRRSNQLTWTPLRATATLVNFRDDCAQIAVIPLAVTTTFQIAQLFAHLPGMEAKPFEMMFYFRDFLSLLEVFDVTCVKCILIF